MWWNLASVTVFLAATVIGCGDTYDSVTYTPPKPPGVPVRVVVPDLHVPVSPPVTMASPDAKIRQPVEIVTRIESAKGGMLMAVFSTESGGQKVVENTAIVILRAGVVETFP